MYITINFLDWLVSSARKEKLIIRVSGPVTILELYKLAQKQVDLTGFSQELENLMVSYKGELLCHETAMKKVLMPGDEILLLPLMSGG